MSYNYWSKNNKVANVQLNLVTVYRTMSNGIYCNKFNEKKNDTSLKRISVKKDDFYGVIHVLQGSGIVETEKKQHILSTNDLLFVKCSEIYNFRSTDSIWEFHSYWFNLFNLDLFFDEIFKLDFLPNEIENNKKLIDLLNADNYYATGLANSILQQMIFEWLNKIVFNTTYSKNSLNPNFKYIHDSVLYINQNITEQLFIPNIAAKYNICDKQYRNLFKKIIGITPKKYIIQSKLERAAYMLTNTSMSVTDIAFDLNFANYGYFLTQFKKIYHLSPLKYKQKSLGI